MSKEISAPNGQAAGRDIRNDVQIQNVDSIHCHGITTCPLRPSRTPESKQQADFYRDTGIWAPAEGRVVLEWLMRDCGFTARDLAVAWGEKSLAWSVKDGRVSALSPWIETLFGWLGFLAMAVLVLITMVPLMTKYASLNNAEIVQLVGALISELVALALAMRFVIWPAKVAFQVRPLLRDYYAGHTSGLAGQKAS